MNGPDTKELKRELGLFPLTNIVIANMVGSGIFTTSGLLMAGLGNPLLLIALWLVGGVVALCGALSYGELGAAYPRAGGEYSLLSALYHPLLGFLSGWVSIVVGFSAPIAASAIGISEYLARAFPAWFSPESAVSPVLLKRAIAVGIIVLFTGIHWRGLKFGSRFQSGLTVIKIMFMVGLMVLGFCLGKGDFGHFLEGDRPILNVQGWKTIGLSLMWILFAYSGWNASTYIGSEIANPRKNLPLSLLLGTLAVTVLYVGINVFYIYSIPIADMKGVISIGGLAVAKGFGDSLGGIFSLLIAIALFSSLSAFIILGPRVTYAMAKDGFFFRFAADIHPKYRTPVKAILFQSVISILVAASGTFDQILTFMGFSLGIFPILAVLGVFRLRRQNGGNIRMPGYPWVQAIYLIVGVSVLVLSFLGRPVESSIAIATVLAGVPAYIYFQRLKNINTNPG